jgi:hypothetical protein
MNKTKRLFGTLCLATLCLAKANPDIPVTTTLTDFNPSNVAYSVQSDGVGHYSNGVSGATSILVANGYNHIVIVNGDWRLDLMGSNTRSARVTLAQANAVQPGDPGDTAPAHPPFWGTRFEEVRMENKCSFDNHDMLTMKAGDKFTCDTSIRFVPAGTSASYRLEMDPVFLGQAETQQAQVSCNSADSRGCNDWFIDPIPVVNPDGSTSPGQVRARLDLVVTPLTDEGDFYVTFHIHVTRP